MTEKLKTLADLKSEIKTYKILLQNYGLKYENVEAFLEQFGLTEEEIVDYVLDLKMDMSCQNMGIEMTKFMLTMEKVITKVPNQHWVLLITSSFVKKDNLFGLFFFFHHFL